MLIVALDTSKKEPLYEQIYNSIKEEIITGVLPFGARLPSARRLSKHLDVSRNTVDTAYAQLCAEGYIESKPKRGFFVCQVEELAELHIPVKIEEEEEEKTDGLELLETNLDDCTGEALGYTIRLFISRS